MFGHSSPAAPAAAAPTSVQPKKAAGIERVKAWPVPAVGLEAPVTASLWVDVQSIDWVRVSTMLNELMPATFRLCAKRCTTDKSVCFTDRIGCGDHTGHGTVAVEFLAALDAPAILSVAVIHQPKKAAYVFGLCVNAHGMAPTSAWCSIAANAPVFFQRLPNLDAQCLAAVWLLMDILNEASHSSSDACTLAFEQPPDATLLSAITAFSTDVTARAASRPSTLCRSVYNKPSAARAPVRASAFHPATNATAACAPPQPAVCAPAPLVPREDAFETMDGVGAVLSVREDAKLESAALLADGIRQLGWTPDTIRAHAFMWLQHFCPTKDTRYVGLMEPLGEPTSSRETETALLHLCNACVRCEFQQHEVETMLAAWGYAPRRDVRDMQDDMPLGSFAFNDDVFQFSTIDACEGSFALAADMRSCVLPADSQHKTDTVVSLKRRRGADARSFEHAESDVETACSTPLLSRPRVDARPLAAQTASSSARAASKTKTLAQLEVQKAKAQLKLERLVEALGPATLTDEQAHQLAEAQHKLKHATKRVRKAMASSSPLL